MTRLLRMDCITRATLRSMPDTLFLFGDNMAGQGMGGQAREMRGEPNAVGVPTKWRPARDARAYFADSDWLEIRERVDAAFHRAATHIASGGRCVVPLGGLGTGLAELPTRASWVHVAIERRIARLAEIAEVLV